MEYRVIRHSAKGSTWEDHKYIKRIDGTYYYPDDYVGGRHLPKGEEGSSNYSEYTKDDPDFDDKNYSDKNRLGNTDFFGFKRDDGTTVILEEDMKWVLPKGTSVTPELIQRLEAFDKSLEGKNYTSKDWQKMAKDAIDGTNQSGATGEKDIEGLAKEVIRGNFGNGAQRKELLGNAYQEVQDRVNEILRSQKSGGSASKKEENKEENKTEEKKEKKKKTNNVELRKKNRRKKDLKPYYGNYEPTSSNTAKHSYDELMHIGMPRRSGRYPWGSGDRPFQSSGGKVSSKRKASDMSDEELTNYIKRKNLEKTYNKMSGQDSSKLEKTRNLVNESSNAMNRASNTMRQDSQQKKWERMDLSNMTDQQLRDRINRENLEIQYSKMFNSSAPEVSKGREYVQKIFDVGGDILSLAGSSLSIALAIKALKAV